MSGLWNNSEPETVHTSTKLSASGEEKVDTNRKYLYKKWIGIIFTCCNTFKWYDLKSHMLHYNHVSKMEVVSLAHRVVLDETFRKDEPVEFRLRYRPSAEKALNGRSVDSREFYLKLNNEYLGIFGGGKPDLEIRASAALGYEVSDTDKIELGLEYRVNEFYTAAKAQQFWITIAWYLSV